MSISSPSTTIITVPNLGGVTNLALFTPGSFAAITTQDGPNSVMIDISGTWSQTSGLSVLFISTQVNPGTFGNPPVRTIPQSDIVAWADRNTSGLASGVTGAFTLGIDGAGVLYVIAGSGTLTGTPLVNLRCGIGQPSIAGADLISLVIPNPLPVTDAAAEASLASIVTSSSTSATAANQTNGNQKAQITANALGSPFTGQKKITVTGTQGQGPALVAVNGIIVTASPLNTAFAGGIGGTVGLTGVTNSVDGTGNGAFLPPGASLSFAVANANLLFVNGIAGDAFSFAVS